MRHPPLVREAACRDARSLNTPTQRHRTNRVAITFADAGADPLDIAFPRRRCATSAAMAGRSSSRNGAAKEGWKNEPQAPKSCELSDQLRPAHGKLKAPA
jgi:hypothetical protein